MCIIEAFAASMKKRKLICDFWRASVSMLHHRTSFKDIIYPFPYTQFLQIYNYGISIQSFQVAHSYLASLNLNQMISFKSFESDGKSAHANSVSPLQNSVEVCQTFEADQKSV